MKRRILWLLLCTLLCTTMAACAQREAPQLPTAEVQTNPGTPEPTQETEPSQARIRQSRPTALPLTSMAGRWWYPFLPTMPLPIGTRQRTLPI